MRLSGNGGDVKTSRQRAAGAGRGKSRRAVARRPWSATWAAVGSQHFLVHAHDADATAGCGNIWCGRQERTVLAGGGGLLNWPCRIHPQIWLALGPHGVSASVAGRTLLGGGAHEPMNAVGVSFAPLAEPVAYHGSGGHTVRVLGHVLTGPRRGTTLVILANAAGDTAAAPALIVRAVAAPAELYSGFVPSRDGTATVMLMTNGSLPPPIMPALRADPVVLRFHEAAGIE